MTHALLRATSLFMLVQRRGRNIDIVGSSLSNWHGYLFYHIVHRKNTSLSQTLCKWWNISVWKRAVYKWDSVKAHHGRPLTYIVGHFCLSSHHLSTAVVCHLTASIHCDSVIPKPCSTLILLSRSLNFVLTALFRVSPLFHCHNPVIP